MKHYFLVDKLHILYAHKHRLMAWEFVAQEHCGFPDEDEAVIVWVSFDTIHNYHTWMQIPGVHELPDALEGEPLPHEHMHRLKRIHGLTHKEHENGSVTWHDHTGAVVDRPTTKKVMNKLAEIHWPSFKFKLF